MDSSGLTTVPFRLTIGVTGHRELEDTETIRETVRQVLNEILKKYSKYGDTEIKLCVLSPLAEGADRLVADEVLKRDGESVLKVVLPLAISDYLEDFSTEQSRQQFRTLMEKARTPLTLRKRPLREEYPPEMLKEVRREAYEDVGLFVGNHCDILIALWDNQPSRGKGGTANIIANAREKKCPVYIINTKKPSEFTFFSGEESSKEIMERTDRLNSHILRLKPQPEYLENQYNQLSFKLEGPEGAKLPKSIKDTVKEKLIPYYSVASSLAEYYQKIYRRVGLLIFWLAFTAVSIVGIGVIFLHSPVYIFIIEFFILACISILIFYANRVKDSHRNWMEYRFLAERLRSAFFMYICGIELSPAFVNRRAGESAGTDAWMSLAFEEIWNRLPRQSLRGEEKIPLLKDYIVKAWIDDQIEYHEKNYEKNWRKGKLFENTGETIFYFAIAVAFLHFATPQLIPQLHSWLLENYLVLAALLLPALAATVEAIRSHRGYKRLALRSRKMAWELQGVKDSFRLLTPEKLESTLMEVEQLMLRETEDWLTLMSFAELYKAV